MDLQNRDNEGFYSTPPELSREMVRLVDPQLGETVYDPACGSGALLIAAYNHISAKMGTPPDKAGLKTLRTKTLYGREINQEAFLFASKNLKEYGIRQPNIWLGNSLNLNSYTDNFPRQYDVVLLTPPFGAKASREAQGNFEYPSSKSELLFLQHAIDSLKPGGRCAAIVSEGLLFRTETPFAQTKRKLLDECSVHQITRFQGDEYGLSNTNIRTSLIFFTKGQPTDVIQYIGFPQSGDITSGHIDIWHIVPKNKGGTSTESNLSWLVSRREIEAQNYQLALENPSDPGRSLTSFARRARRQRTETSEKTSKDGQGELPAIHAEANILLQDLTVSATGTVQTDPYRIFISYRRNDCAWTVALLHTILKQELQATRIFRDIDAIDVFEDFPQRINTALDSCDVLIAVIGGRWLGKSKGRRRIDNPDDYVRLEVSTALKRGIWVYPILIDNAKMPQDLPEDITALARINALRLTTDTLDQGVNKLISKLQEVVGTKDGTG